MAMSKDNTSYQYLRFNNGKEIFAMVREVDNKLELTLPMSILARPGMTGGITLHLGPFIPYTKDESIVVETKDITYRTSLDKQYISFYDDAVTAWLDMRDNNKVEVMTEKEDNERARKELAGIIEKRLKNITKEEMFAEDLEDEDLFSYEDDEPKTLH
tara:strand:+ start:3133 stop:3606 length:474 start_codon:yes stop_codon:yes gene_type:complete